ncbi:hypothetical protein DV20_13450 [Amycolatopsis rifamycinica]|uniref:Uncharacterized protein n=1 Tax=Amycolatopsis rifamycinica TaxID=287986 RepID=A0A066U378_9PSEU|nr:hypothetical protein DV20_13450 [Amycolatopsis rifamycinica]
MLTAVVGVLGAGEAHAEPKNTAGQPSPPPAKQSAHQNTGSANAAEHRQETAAKKRQAATAGSEKAAERRRETAEKKEAEATKEGSKKPSGSANAAERRRENADKKAKADRRKVESSQAGRGEQRERSARQDRWANASPENKKQAESARQRKEKTARPARNSKEGTPSRSTTSVKHDDKGGRPQLRLASGSSRDPDGDFEFCTLGGESCDEAEMTGGTGSHDMPELEDKPLKVLRPFVGGGLPFFGSGGGKGGAAPPPARGTPPAAGPQKAGPPAGGPGGGKGQSGGGPVASEPPAPEQPPGGKGATVRPTPPTEPPTLPRGSSAGPQRAGGSAPSRATADRTTGKGGGKSADRTEGRSGRKSPDRSRGGQEADERNQDKSTRKTTDRTHSSRKPDNRNQDKSTRKTTDRTHSSRKPDNRNQDKSNRETTERPHSRKSADRAANTSGGKPVERAAGRSGDRRGEPTLAEVLAAKGKRYEKQEKEFLEQGKDIYGNTIPAGADAGKMAQEFRHHSRYEPFTPDGKLTAVAVEEAFPVQAGEVIGNPYVKEVFARSGGPSQWAKYSTRTHHSPYGDFQIHFYHNRTTGEVYYGHDYKVVMNRRIED